MQIHVHIQELTTFIAIVLTFVRVMLQVVILFLFFPCGFSQSIWNTGEPGTTSTGRGPFSGVALYFEVLQDVTIIQVTQYMEPHDIPVGNYLEAVAILRGVLPIGVFVKTEPFLLQNIGAGYYSSPR